MSRFNRKSPPACPQRFDQCGRDVLTVGDVEPALAVEADVGVDDVRAEARVDGGGGPLALEVAHDLLPRAADGRRAVRPAGRRGRRA